MKFELILREIEIFWEKQSKEGWMEGRLAKKMVRFRVIVCQEGWRTLTLACSHVRSDVANRYSGMAACGIPGNLNVS